MPRPSKGPVTIGHYQTPTPDGWAGWVENKAQSWILFFTKDGEALFYHARDKSGAVTCEGVATDARHEGL